MSIILIDIINLLLGSPKYQIKMEANILIFIIYIFMILKIIFENQLEA